MTASLATPADVPAPKAERTPGRRAGNHPSAADGADRAENGLAFERQIRDPRSDKVATTNPPADEETRSDDREEIAKRLPRDVSLVAILAAMGSACGTETKASLSGARTLDGQGPLATLKGQNAEDGDADTGGRLPEIAATSSDRAGTSRDGSIAGGKAGTRVDFVSLRTDFAPGTPTAKDAFAAGANAGSKLESAVLQKAAAAVSVNCDQRKIPTRVDAPTTPPKFRDGVQAQALTVAGSTSGQDVGKELLSSGGNSRDRSHRNSTSARADVRLDASRFSDASIDGESSARGSGNSTLSGQVATSLAPTLENMAGRAKSAAAANLSGGAPTATEPQAQPMRAGGAAMKTLQIQLQPQTLGKLDVTMKLVGGQLAIHLVASEADTAMRLKDDADGLKRLLTKAGFAVDEAAITIAARDPSAARQAGNPASQHSSGQPGSQNQSFDGMAGNGGEQFGGGEPSSEQQQARKQRPTVDDGTGVAPTEDRRSAADASIYL